MHSHAPKTQSKYRNTLCTGVLFGRALRYFYLSNIRNQKRNKKTITQTKQDSNKTEINNHKYIHTVDLYHIKNENVWRVTVILSSNYGNKTVGVIPVKCIHLIVRARRMNLLMNSMKDSGGDEITTRSSLFNIWCSRKCHTYLSYRFV